MNDNNDKKIQNNNILVDLIIKSSRVQTLINMLIDVNNGPMFNINNDDNDLLISSNQYKELQDCLINCINLLSDLVVNETKKVQGGLNGRQEQKNNSTNQNEFIKSSTDNYEF